MLNDDQNGNGSGLANLHHRALRIISFYSTHDWLNFLYLVPVGLVYFLVLYEEPYLALVVFASMFGVHFILTKPRMHSICQSEISAYSKKFSNSPSFNQVTSDDLLDAIDYEILTQIDDVRQEGGDYINLVPKLSDLIDLDEAFERLGKYKSLGIIRTLQSRIALTARGLEYIASPHLPAMANVPPRYSKRLAIARIYLDEGNFAGVVDEIYKIFETLLRDTISNSLGDELPMQWKKLQTVRSSYEKATLGALLHAADELKLLRSDSFSYKLIDAFMSMRNPLKHATAKESSVEAESVMKADSESARTSYQLGETLLRQWFH